MLGLLPSLASCLFSYDKATVEGTASLLESYQSATQVSAAARAK